MREFALEFEIRKGLGPETFLKTVFVGLDDLDLEATEEEIRAAAIQDAEEQLSKSDDYLTYGKNWRLLGVQNA